jgi:hypothetical protein
MSKHTSGSWSAVTHSWSDINVYSDKKCIAKLSIYDEATEDTEHDLHYEMFANARLISAAPELMEALDEIVDEIKSKCYHPELEHLGGLIINAQKIIAKARGES